MKGLTIAASVVVILMISAVALVIVNADDAATASQTETTEPDTDVPLPEFMEERLQDLVERGFITQEQLDEMERRFQEHRPWNGERPEDFDPEQFRERFREHRPWNGELPEGLDPEHFMGPGFGPHGFWFFGEDENLNFMGPGFGPHGFWFFGEDENLMGLFGVTPEELMDALAEGTPPIDVIEDPDAFLDSLVGPIEERLDQAVEDGRLTQAEADELIEEALSRAEAFINGETFHGEGFMGRRGPGGFHGYGDFGPHHRNGADTATASYSA